MRCVIWNHLYDLKNVKNTHGGVLLLVKLPGWNFTKSSMGVFHAFLIGTNGIKSRKASHIFRPPSTPI